MKEGDPYTNQAFDLEAPNWEDKEKQETEALDVEQRSDWGFIGQLLFILI